MVLSAHLFSPYYFLSADGFPSTINAYPECTAVVRAASAKIVGAERASAPQKTMGAEDFSFFLQECPGKNQNSMILQVVLISSTGRILILLDVFLPFYAQYCSIYAHLPNLVLFY